MLFVRDVSAFMPDCLFGFFAYPFLRSIEEIEPLPRFWLFLALIPMGLDWSLGFFGIWENTHFSRFLTGLILGIMCAIFIIPALIELAELFAYKSKKAVRLTALKYLNLFIDTDL